MIKLITIVLAIVFLSYSPTASIAQAPTRGTNQYTPKELAEHYTTISQGEAKYTSAVIRCESQYNPKARGDSGRALGVGQFHKPTFERLSKLMGEELDYNSYYDQTKLLAWSLDNGYGANWTAYRAIKNGGTYSFYSKLLGKHYTSVCRA